MLEAEQEAAARGEADRMLASTQTATERALRDKAGEAARAIAARDAATAQAAASLSELEEGREYAAGLC